MCLSPITKLITLANGGKEVVTFPCGRCLECVAKYQNEWSLRLSEEAKHWQFAIFVTLKYGNSRIPLADVDISEHYDYITTTLSRLPANRIGGRYVTSDYEYLHPTAGNVRCVPVLAKADIQTLFKRVRARLTDYNIKDSNAFKYYVTGEYGPTTLRPHWHAIIYTDILPCILTPILSDVWHDIAGDVGDTKHHFDSSVVRDAVQVGRYVAKYCSKPAAFENPYVVAGLISRPCHLISKGIGSRLRDDICSRVQSLCKRYNVPYTPRREILAQMRECRKAGKSYAAIRFNRIVRRPPDAFFAELEDLFTRKIMSHGKLLTYSVPRYYKDCAMPQTIYYTTRYNEKKQCYEDIEILRKDPKSTLAEARRAYIALCQLEDYNRRVADIMARTGVSYDAAHRLAAVEEVENLYTRYRTRLNAFVKFYGKGYYKSITTNYE